MIRYSNTVRDQYGAPVSGALVAVKNQNGVSPTLYDDTGYVIGNPVATDPLGSYYFNVTAADYYDLSIYFGHRLVTTEYGVPVGSPGPADSTLRTDLSSGGGALVGLTQAGLGATLRNLQLFLGEMPLTPEQFGAGGAGTTDDDLAWTNCIRRATASGQPILAKGIYRVTQVTLPGNIRISGAGVGKMVKKPGTKGHLFYTTSNSNAIEDMILDATTTSQVPGTGGAYHSDNDIIQINGGGKNIVRRCTITGAGIVDIGGGGVAIYNGRENLVEFNKILNVRDNSVIVSGIGADGNRVLHNVLDGTYAQNNVYFTAQSASDSSPIGFIYDNEASFNYCFNSGDTGIEFGCHTVRSVGIGNTIGACVNPGVLLRDSTYFSIANNVVVADLGKVYDLVAVVPQIEGADWECNGTISGNVLNGAAPRSGIYAGQSRLTIDGNRIERPKHGVPIATDGSTLLGQGVLVAFGANYVDVVGNKIRGWSDGVRFNFGAISVARYTGCTVTGNTFEMNEYCINAFQIAADGGMVFANNTAVGVRTNFLKGDNAVIVPTTTYPNAQIRCYNNSFDPKGFGQVGVMYSSGVRPKDGLLTSASALILPVTDTNLSTVTLSTSDVHPEGILIIMFINDATGATFVLSHAASASYKIGGTADLVDTTGASGTVGWAVIDSAGTWVLQRRAATPGTPATRYAVVDFRGAL